MSVVVVVPIYRAFAELSVAEVASLKQTLTVLAAYPVSLVCPEGLDVTGYEQLNKAVGGTLKIDRMATKYFGSIRAYNNLLWSKTFYQHFAAYQYLFIHHVDAWIFRDELQQWVDRGYDYIGAPVFEGFDKNQDLQYSVFLNGGCSLRNIASSLKIIKRIAPLRYLHFLLKAVSLKQVNSIGGFIRFMGLEKLLKIKSTTYLRPLLGGMGVNNEDLRWCWAAETFTDFTKPDPVTAIPFAFEFHPSYLFELNEHRLPMACHAWERYEPEFWKAYIKI